MWRTFSLLLLAAPAANAFAQNVRFTGHVLADSIPHALAGAEVSLVALQVSQRTNERGEFVFQAVPAGEYVVLIRMPGYAPKVDTIEVADAGDIRREYRLSRIQATLPEVPVTTTLLDRKLADFLDRKHRLGMGRFLDSAEFSKAAGTRTSDRLRRLSGLVVHHGRGMSASIGSSRGIAIRTCRADVWLDGLNIGQGFDVNSIDPSEVAGIEWYPGIIPAQFTSTQKLGIPTPCGALVIWLR